MFLPSLPSLLPDLFPSVTNFFLRRLIRSLVDPTLAAFISSSRLPVSRPS